MKILRIYIDTSVIGGCCDIEFKPWSNGLLKDFQLGNFKPVLSEIVSAEIKKAPVEVLNVYSELLACDPEFVDITEEAFQLADAYYKRGILSLKFKNDLMHIALATIASVDILVSWNFKHVVHYDKIRLFNAVNLEMNYIPIQIYSPREVTNYGKEKDQSR